MFAVLSASIPAAFAYLTDMDQKENRIGFTENEIRIEEDFEPPTDPKPGTVIRKSPRLVNESEIPVYVRMSARFTNEEAESFCLPLEIRSGWELHADGYYYYADKLDPGETTASLFDQVVIRQDVNVSQLVPFDLLIYAESVQCLGDSKEEAWAYFEKS